MSNQSTPQPARRRVRRQGSTLVVTMIVIATVASLLAVSTEQMLGMHKLNGLQLATQTNAYAAEGCAGMIEGFLENATNNDPALVQDIAPASPPSGITAASLAQTWNNFAGYTGNVPSPNPYAPGQTSWPTMWINNCMVTWRIEPVTIYDTTFVPSGSTPSGNYTVNYNALLPTTGSTAGVVNNPGFFQYRMVVTSYYMDLNKMANTYGQTMANATPWSNPGEALSVIQVQRQIQLHLLNLFQYVIFYAAVGPAGDIEFHPGGALTITGAVHSNGAIYFGGTSLSGTNYHAPTCQGSQITVGTTAAPVGIDAPGGIYRQQKDANAWMAINIPSTNTPSLTVLNPAQVPMRNNFIGGIAMTGNNDLNGDTDTNTNVMLNGTALVSTNDSRSGLKVANGTKYIRDSSSGSGVVSLSNFPDLKGYAFEPQLFVPSADTGTPYPLYWKGLAAGGQPQTWNQYEFTINTALYPNAQQLYYSAPGGYPSAIPTAYPVYATDMPLWTMKTPDGTGTYQDVWPSGTWVPGYYNFQLTPSGWSSYPNYPTGVGPFTQPYLPKISINKGYIFPPATALPNVPSTLDTYLPEVVQPTPPATLTPALANGMPAEGHYFAQSLHGASGTATTGLTIRERGAPNLLFTFDLVEHPPVLNAAGTTWVAQQGHLIMSDANPGFWCAPDASQAVAPGWVGGSPTQLYGAEYLNAYAAMMMSRYVVYFGNDSNGNPFDITIPFFRYGLGLASLPPASIYPSYHYVLPAYASGAPNGSGCGVLYFGNIQSLENIAYLLPESAWQQNPTPSGLIATSDQFCNPREGAWLENNRYLGNAAAWGPTPANYRMDALTLNIGQICSFIQNTTWNQVSTNAQQATTVAGGTALSAMFNGVIYAHRTHRTLTPICWGTATPPYYYAGQPWFMSASDATSYGIAPPPPPPTPTSYGTPGISNYSPQGAAGVAINPSYQHYLTYPNLNGYTTLFLPSFFNGWAQDAAANADHSLPIYDPLKPLGYSPLETYDLTNGFYKTPASLVTTMNLGANSNCPYPVFGTTTPTNGGVVGVGTTQARVGMPYVWSVYPSPLAVRLYNGKAVNWGGVQPAANNRPQGLTVITPNTCYIWGDYNITTFPDASGTQQITPCAVFCDGLTTLSNAWSDLAGSTATYTGGVVGASSTSYIVSVMINNQPTDFENTYEEGSDGTHNVIRYAENWGTGGSGGGASTWTFQGSLVVLNRTRYGRSYVPGSQPNGTIDPFLFNGNTYASCGAGSFYGVPSRVYKFNSDLLTQAGQPPQAPHGITVQRVVSTININNH